MKFRQLGTLPMEPLDNARLRQLRDAMLAHLYEKGAGTPFWGDSIENITHALGMTGNEFGKVANLLQHQGMLSLRVPRGSLGLSAAGQLEAERLGPQTAFREAPVQSAPHVHVGGNMQGVIQISGTHSNLSATVHVEQSVAYQLLDEVEQAVAHANLSPEKKSDAMELVSSLRTGLKGRIGAATNRVLATTLEAILKGAGSEAGKKLLDHIVRAVT